MPIFGENTDQKLIEFGVLPVATPEDYSMFRDRERLGILGITCPIPIQYDQNDVDEFYRALRDQTLTEFFGAKGSCWQIGISTSQEHILNAFPQKLADIARLVKPAFRRAVTNKPASESGFDVISFRINSTHPNEIHQHTKNSCYPTILNIDGDSTIVRKERNGKEELSLPQKSMTIMLGRLWHKAANLQTQEGNQRLTIQYIRSQPSILPYDRTPHPA